ncbi:unnamed protein product, partial [Hapterophycus canaliculatus]
GGKERVGLARGVRGGSSNAGGGVGVGGFPEVRHRSQMGLVKLGGGAAASPAAATRTAAAAAAADGTAKKLTGAKMIGGCDDGGGGGGGGIPGDIHEENLSRVSAMSPDEIAEAQQEIRAALPPGALEMLMRRGRGGGRQTQGVAATVVAATAAAVTAEEEVEHKRGSNGVDSSRTTPTATATAANTTVSNATIAGATATESTASGAPTGAQRAATAAGGIGSEEALEAALLTLPPEERAKSSWTLDGDVKMAQASGGSGSGSGGSGSGGGGGGRGKRGREARVDLDGVVVPPAPAPAPAGGGAGEEERGREALHHHGDDPGEAGYTPSEMVRLARSTVSGQRQLALRALAGVLRIRAACVARGEAPPHPRLPETLPVVLRMCLDDGNPSVASAALIAVEAFLAPLARHSEEEERAMQGLSWMDYQ